MSENHNQLFFNVSFEIMSLSSLKGLSSHVGTVGASFTVGNHNYQLQPESTHGRHNLNNCSPLELITHLLSQCVCFLYFRIIV